MAVGSVFVWLLFIGLAAYLSLRNGSGEFLDFEQRFSMPTAISAVVGTYIVDYLVVPGVAIPPIGAIYIIDAMFIHRYGREIQVPRYGGRCGVESGLGAAGND